MKTVRIGSGAGYAGDRIEPAVELMEKGALDYIIFECLAERTISIGQMDKAKDESRGYNRLLDYRMRRILPLVKKNGVKVITNMGAANPESAARRTAELARELGVTGLKIAYVCGDDIYGQLGQYGDHPVLENGRPLKELKTAPLSANAYMGADGILEALKGQADLVITGRVSDPALTIAPLQYEFGWNIEENPEEMGQAVLAGHLLECAGQVTGGYYADPGFKEVPDLYKLGFPLVEVGEDGVFTVTKVEGSGGVVNVDTVKEQIIYEIHNPKAYLTPDAVADFSQVRVEQAGKDRVLVQGALSHGRPDTLKVSVGYRDCYIGTGEMSYGGSNALARARLAAEVIEKRLELIQAPVEELRIDFIGYNSLYRSGLSDEIVKAGRTYVCGGEKEIPEAGIPEVRLRVSGRFAHRENAGLIGKEVEALYTNGPAGGGGASGRVEEIVSICSIFVPRESIKAIVTYLEVKGGAGDEA